MAKVRNLVALAALVVVGAIFASPTLASANQQCVTQPATVTMVENTNSTSTSTTHIHVVVKKTTRAKIKQFEKAHNVIVAINRHKPVRSSKRCKDPVKAGWINPGDPFKNTRKGGRPFTDSWQQGLEICKFHIIHRGGKTIAKGTKNNCGNEGIEIVIHGRKPKPQTRQVIEFHTVKEFRSVYDKWVTVTNNSSSNSSDTVAMQFTCAPGFTLIEGGLCRKCDHPQPPVTPPSPTISNVTQPQEVYVNETYPNFRANVTAPAGDTVKVIVGTRFGVGYTKTITSTGSDTVSGTYTAPTDLPFVWTPPAWSGIAKADTWEQVHVTATDQTTGLSSNSTANPPQDPESYVWFPIMESPAPPE